jgi:hypothetical protein
MSNHSGSYMLNEVFRRLHKAGFVKKFGPKKAQNFLLEITQWACRQYDCNEGEILDELGRKYGLCGYCLKPVPKVIENWCLKCRAELLEPEELTPAERKALKEAAAVAKAATP